MKKHIMGTWPVLALIVGLALAACQSKAPPSETEVQPPAEAESGAQVQSAVSKDIRLDPATTSDEDSLLVSSYIYEGLVGLEGGSVATPALAASWVVSDDGLDYIFTLRPNMVFHDGTPVDADAVIANFNRWFDPASDLRGSGSYDEWESVFLGFKGETNADGTPKSTFDGIEKVDDLTVLIHLSRQDPSLLANLSRPAFSIVSPTALAAGGDNYGTASGSAIGSGPYMVGEWSGDKLVLEPNPNYWDEVPSAALEFPLQ